MNPSGREKILLLGVVALGGGALLYNFVIEPVFVRFVVLKGEIEEKKVQVIKSRKMLQEYEPVKAEYAKYPTLVTKGLKEEEELAQALTEIEAISKQTTCSVTGIKPRTSKKIGAYKEISIEVTLEGDMGQISKFMKAVETSVKLLKVKRFVINATTTPGKLKAALVIAKIILT